MSFTLLT